MGSGTEVAKDASAMILMDDNFATIVKAVESGRTIYNNIKKSITYLFSGNLGGIISIVFALFANLPNPFTTIQLLFINLVTDSLPAIALGLEKPEKGVMDMPVRDSDESILDKETLKTIGLRGTIIGIVTIIAQYIGMKSSPELGCAMAFLTLTLSRILQTLPSRSNTETLVKLGFTTNKYVLIAVGTCLVMLLATLLPFMRGIFEIPVSFTLENFITCLVLALISSSIMEATKLIKRK